MSEPKFVNRNGILIPETREHPDKIGFGCSKCDQCEVIPFLAHTHDLIQKVASAFLKLHEGHGPIHCIEVRGSKVYVTGELIPDKSPAASPLVIH